MITCKKDTIFQTPPRFLNLVVKLFLSNEGKGNLSKLATSVRWPGLNLAAKGCSRRKRLFYENVLSTIFHFFIFTFLNWCIFHILSLFHFHFFKPMYFPRSFTRQNSLSLTIFRMLSRKTILWSVCNYFFAIHLFEHYFFSETLNLFKIKFQNHNNNKKSFLMLNHISEPAPS